MSDEKKPQASGTCMNAQCDREPYHEGECWLCPDCAEKLHREIFRLRTAAAEEYERGKRDGFTMCCGLGLQ